MPVTPHALCERFAFVIRPNIRIAIVAVALLLAAHFSAFGQPTRGQAQAAAPAKTLPIVSPIFGDNMVLQRGKPDTLWGWSDPGDTIRVQMGDNNATGTAGPDHRWQVKIRPPAPGGPYTVKITGHGPAPSLHQ